MFREIKVPGFDASQFHTEQVFYTSKDGTRVPMFLVHKKGSTPFTQRERERERMRIFISKYIVVLTQIGHSAERAESGASLRLRRI